MGLFSGIKVGDVVRVKFKDIKAIKEEQSMLDGITLFDTWEIGDHLSSFTYGGDFVVHEIKNFDPSKKIRRRRKSLPLLPKKSKQLQPSSTDDLLEPDSTLYQTISLVDHLDGGIFTFIDAIVESVEILDIVHKFEMPHANLIITQIDGTLYFNGVALDNENHYHYDEYKVPDEGKYLDNFIKFMETYITSKVMDSSLVDDENNDKKA